MPLRVKEYAFFPTPKQPEYGLLFCVDEEGAHVTLRGDPRIVKELRDRSDPSPLEAGEKLADEATEGRWEGLAGWPDDDGSEAQLALQAMFARLNG